MTPPTAKSMALAAITAAEQAAAQAMLASAHGAHSVRFIDMDITLRSFSAAPVYAPVYIFSGAYAGTWCCVLVFPACFASLHCRPRPSTMAMAVAPPAGR